MPRKIKIINESIEKDDEEIEEPTETSPVVEPEKKQRKPRAKKLIKSLEHIPELEETFEEPKEVNKTSPVIVKKKNKYGI